MENEKNTVIIKCPHCGAEYTIDEIFIPKYLTGKTSTVVKDALGKILYVEFEENPDLTEEFICDYCNNKFSTSVEITSKINKVDEVVNYSEQTVSLF